MKQDSAQHSKVPDVVASARVVERAWPPLLRNLRRVNNSANQVHAYALADGRVEVIAPGRAPRQVQLDDWREAGRGQGDVEGHASPCHVLAVEGGMPGQDGAKDTHHGGEGHVDGAGYGLAVKGSPLCGKNARGNQERYSGVVHACKAVEDNVVCDAVHRMPYCGTEKTFAGGGEEARRDEYIGLGAEGEDGAGRVEVEGDGEDKYEANGMRPDIYRFI